MFGKRDKTYTFDLAHAGAKAGRLENLPPTVSIQELHGLVRARCGLSDEYNVRLMAKGGRELPTEGGVIIGDVEWLKPGTIRALVISSLKEKRAEPVDPAGDEAFEQLEKLIVNAEERFQQGAWREAAGEEKKKQLMWFNCVVEVMTKLDALKQSCRPEYDRNERGRTLIKRCSALLDRVENVKN